MYWLMAHWIGRKYKLSIAQVHRKFRRDTTFGTNQRTLLLPQVFKAKRYLAKTMHNPYLDTETAITRKTGMSCWRNGEARKHAREPWALKECVYQRDKGICGLCEEPVEKREAELDHKSHGPGSNMQMQPTIRPTCGYCIEFCHTEKTKRDLYA